MNKKPTPDKWTHELGASTAKSRVIVSALKRTCIIVKGKPMWLDPGKPYPATQVWAQDDGGLILDGSLKVGDLTYPKNMFKVIKVYSD